MKLLKIALLCLVSCFPSATAQVPVEEPSIRDSRHLVESVVGLVTDKGRPYCAGVVHRYLVLTAAHCTEEVDAIVNVGYYRHYRDYAFDHSFKFKVLSRDEVQDFAVLIPQDVTPEVPGVLLSKDGPVLGEKIYIVGHPGGLGYSVGSGVVSWPRRGGVEYDPMVWVQLHADVSPGNSGGPVFNQFGELIGLVSFYRIIGGNPQQHLAGAIHWETIKGTLYGL